MPAPGEQWRTGPNCENPYEPSVPRMCNYTAQEIATLQSRLDKQLGPEYVSSRPGAGGSKVHYVTAEKVINLANEVFGFNGWSSQIQVVQVDFCDENPNTGKISIGLSVITRVTLKDGTFHEDIGYGQIDNCKGKAAAFEKAKKEGATDALKRALRTFGNVLGNCLYDKSYLDKIQKVKAIPTKWDPDNLHRHADYAPLKKEDGKKSKENTPEPYAVAAPNGNESRQQSVGTELDDDFGGNLFDEVDLGPARPDEVVTYPNGRANTDRLLNNPQHRPPNPSRHFQSGALGAQTNRPSNLSNTETLEQPRPQQQQPPQNQGPIKNSTSPHAAHVQSAAGLHEASGPRPNQPPVQMHEPPVGFVTSRALADLVKDQEASDVTVRHGLPSFNPMADSPSIRRTGGVNHAASGPVLRAAVTGGAANGVNPAPPNVASANAAAGRPPPINFVNPSENIQRRLGAPGGGMSPMSNRTAYKPPTMAAGLKRQFAGVVDGAARPALADVSNTIGQGLDVGGDVTKKQKISEV